MPTINPRINVTLSPSLYGMVGELAKYQRVSRSMVLRELLEASEPALAQVVAMMRAAEDMSEAAKSRLLTDMDSALVKLEATKDEALALAAGATADLVAQAESIRGRRPGRRAGGVRQRPTGSAVRPDLSDSSPAPSGPPSSNRGVKSLHTATETIAKNHGLTREDTAKHRVKTKGGQGS